MPFPGAAGIVACMRKKSTKTVGAAMVMLLIPVIMLSLAGCAGTSRSSADPGRAREEPIRKTASPALTEVIVIGTVHTATPAYDEQDLYALLEDLDPDLILLELPPSFFTADYELESYEGSMEMETAHRYACASGTPLRPYDIEGRNRYYREQNWFERERAFLGDLECLYRGDALSEDGKMTARQLYVSYRLRDAFRDQPPRIINSSACDRVVEIKNKVASSARVRLTESEPGLEEHREYAELKRDFWQRRNRRMVSNIAEYVEEHPGSRIAVLSGFEHTYFLREALAERQEAGKQEAGSQETGFFSLRYYWEVTDWEG